MCFVQPPETPAAAPPVSDNTAADSLSLGTNAVQQRSAGILGRLGLTSTRGTVAPLKAPAKASDAGARDVSAQITAPSSADTSSAPIPGQKHSAGNKLGPLRGILPEYLRRPPAP